MSLKNAKEIEKNKVELEIKIDRDVFEKRQGSPCHH